MQNSDIFHSPAMITLKSTASLIIYALEINWHEWYSLSNVDLCTRAHGRWSNDETSAVVCFGCENNEKKRWKKKEENIFILWAILFLFPFHSLLYTIVWLCKHRRFKRVHNNGHYYIYTKCYGMSPIVKCVHNEKAHGKITAQRNMMCPFTRVRVLQL